MAIFMKNSHRSMQPILKETPGMMFIGGHGHTSDTFKPLYGSNFVGSPTYDSFYLMLNSSKSINVNRNISTYNLATVDDYTSAASFNTDACTGGFQLKKAINVAATESTFSCYKDYSVVYGAGLHTSHLGIQLASIGSIYGDLSILFENDTHIFVFSSHGSAGFFNASAGNCYPIQAVPKYLSGASAANLLPGTTIPASSGSTMAKDATVVSLLELDQENKKATFLCIKYNTSPYGNLPWGVESNGSTGVAIITLNGESAGGTVTIRDIPKPTGAIPDGASTTHRQRVYVDHGKAISHGSKRTFFILDRTASTATITPYAVTYDVDIEVPITSATLPTIALSNGNYSSACRTVSRILERESHFFMFVMSGINKRNPATNNSTFKIAVYRGEKSDPTALTLVSEFKYRDNMVVDYLHITDDYTQMMLVYADTNPDIIEWNEASESFSVKATLDQKIKCAAVDSFNRLWYIDTNNALHLQGPSVGNTIRVGFEDNNINYKGEQLNTAVLTSCFNVMGDRVANNITLQIEGNTAVFAETGTNKVTVMSSLTNDLRVPVTITGNGYIRVVANMAI